MHVQENVSLTTYTTFGFETKARYWVEVNSVEQIQEVGTHSVFMCRVVAIKQSQQDESLVYFNRAYHQVGQLETV